MTINNQIKMKSYSTISTLSSRKLHKYEYLTGEDILSSSNQQVIEQARFTYYPLGKALDKQIKTIKDQGKKQVDALNTIKSDNHEKLEIKNKNIIPKSACASDEAKKEINKILKIEKNIDREKLVYDAGKYMYDFRTFNIIRTFGEDIYEGKITLEEADEDQSDLTDEINKFIKETRPKKYDKKQEKKLLQKTCVIFSMQGKWFLMGLKAKYF